MHYHSLPKRLLIGRAKRSEALHETLLPKKIALPVFASDALSSVAYAPEEVLLVLSAAGLSYYSYSGWVALAVVVLMLTVVASYRQNVRAYPSGGGDYEVVTTNLGAGAGLTVAGALMVDYVMTVSVSVAAGVTNLASAMPFFATHKVLAASVIITVLTVMNLRGVKESGRAFAVLTYGFIVGVTVMLAVGFFRIAVLGQHLSAPSAAYEITPALVGLNGLAVAFLVLRAFSSGCAALTGVEAISNGVPSFKAPKSRNAATTLLVMGLIAVSMFSGIIALARLTHVKIAEDPATQVLINGQPAGEGFHQEGIIPQVAAAVFGHGSLGFLALSAVTALILFLAANTAFNGFPVLASILAQHRYLPRQLFKRGDRLAYSNGIIVLASAAVLIVWAFGGEVTRLIQLYIVGVFLSFSFSQAGMIRHWNRLLHDPDLPVMQRRRMYRCRAINTLGLVMTSTVLVIVLATKFLHGAWIVCLAIPVLILIMRGIATHYERVARELAVAPGQRATLPSRVHALVLVSRIHKPALRALAYAQASHPTKLEGLTVAVDPQEAAQLQQEWDAHEITIPLTVLDSPYREITGPVIDYVRSIRRDNPRDLVSVYVPEYVVRHWWEHLLHNQSAWRIKTRLLFMRQVMVTSVPWQLHGAEASPVQNASPAQSASPPPA